MNPVDKMMAWAQIGLSVLFIVGTFLIIGLYELGHAHFSADQGKDFSSTLNWLTGACMLVMFFWFQRQRSAGIPDGSNVVTQTHTGADGSTTVVTSPMNAPAAAVPTFAKPSPSATPGESNAVPVTPVPIQPAPAPIKPAPIVTGPDGPGLDRPAV